jgi:hypothetical protein
MLKHNLGNQIRNQMTTSNEQRLLGDTMDQDHKYQVHAVNKGDRSCIMVLISKIPL